jgi:hypothetical protein
MPQHKLVVADFRFWVRFQRSKHVQAPRTKWWKLKKDVAKAFRREFLRRALGMKKVMQIACGLGWPLALEK